jgi:hypothetical protein
MILIVNAVLKFKLLINTEKGIIKNDTLLYLNNVFHLIGT